MTGSGAGPLNAILGADSLLVPRSGVGRMTAEIAREIRAAPDLELRLLVRGRLRGADLLDAPAPETAVQRSRLAEAARAALAGMPSLRAARDGMIRARLDRDAARLAANGRPVIYHEPNMIVTPSGVPTVATFNDLSWLHLPDAHPADRIGWIGRTLPRTLRQAARFVAVSEFTAAGMAAELGLPRDRIDVVPLAPSPAFRPLSADAARPVLARLGLEDRGYILSVSTLEPRKNFDGLFAAWRQLPDADRARFPLAIVGGKGWGRVLADPAADREAAAGRLRLLGRVGDADLVALYARCAVSAYVSHYEGFGLPLLEAMAAGAPTIASATTACGQTAGSAAALVDPQDPSAIAAALAQLLGDPAEADRLRAAGLHRAAQYTWPRTLALLRASWRRALTSENPFPLGEGRGEGGATSSQPLAPPPNMG